MIATDTKTTNLDQMPNSEASKKTVKTSSFLERVKLSAQESFSKLSQFYEKFSFEFIVGEYLLTATISVIIFATVTPAWVALAVGIAGFAAMLLLNKLFDCYLKHQHLQNYKDAAQQISEIYEKINEINSGGIADSDCFEDLSKNLMAVINELQKQIKAINAITDQKVPQIKQCVTSFKLNSSLDEPKRLLGHCNDKFDFDDKKEEILLNLQQVGNCINAQIEQIRFFIQSLEKKPKE
jgi:hypothetical protein